MRYIAKHSIPKKPTNCIALDCIYNGEEELDGAKVPEGVCNNPFINSGNGDAECYGKTARSIIAYLQGKQT